MNLKALVAEFLGTFTLIFIGVASGVVAGPNGLVTVALAHGLAIAVMASAVGAISGGHFNPAVSFGAWVGRKISTANLIAYWVSQLAGAVVGARLVMFAFASWKGTVDGVPALSGTTTAGQGFVLEAVGTFLLVFVVYGTAIDRRAPKMGALFIGLTISICIMAFGPLTGSSINPARFLGPALIQGIMMNPMIYIAGPLVGGGLAGLLYNYFLAEKDPEMPVSTLAP